jgi:ABC-type lipoprotein release transport system permease subunit
VKIYGIDPSKEKLVSNIHEKLIEGNYLDTLAKGKPILIGENLATTLDVKYGSKQVVGMVDSDGHPVYYQFRVGGIFKTVSTVWDVSNAFVRYSDLVEITNLPAGAVHEIAIYLTDEKISAEVSEKISSAFPAADVKEWDELMPELSYLNEQMDTYMYIFILIILFALGFGIVNTMLMVVLERVKELGMLMAVGMNKKRIFGMIMLETVFLSLSGGLAGIFIGGLVSKFFEHKGINLSKFYGEGLSAYGYDSIIFTSLEMHMIVVTSILVLITGMIASVFPAIRALRLNPSSAIRSDF